MANVKCSRNASFAFFLIFFVFFVVAFSTPFWVQAGSVRYGLWRLCVDSGIFSDNCRRMGNDGGSMFNASRAMMCLALICYSVAFVMYCVWVSKSPSYLAQHGAGPIGTAALSITLCGGLFNLIAVAVFGSIDVDTFGWSLDWSFGMACACCATILINSVITLAVNVCCFEQEPSYGGRHTVPAPTATMTVITTSAPPPTDYSQQAFYPAQQQSYPPPTQGVQYPPQPYPPQNNQYPAQPYPYTQQPIQNQMQYTQYPTNPQYSNPQY